MLEDDNVEELADAEVEKIILEITQGKLKDLPDPSQSLPANARGLQDQAAAAALPDDEDEEEPLEDMSKRLEALRS